MRRPPAPRRLHSNINTPLHAFNWFSSSNTTPFDSFRHTGMKRIRLSSLSACLICSRASTCSLVPLVTAIFLSHYNGASAFSLSLSDSATKRGADAIQEALGWIKEQEEKLLKHSFDFSAYELPPTPVFTPDHHDYGDNLDIVRARAGILRAYIRGQELRLQQMEEQAVCSEYGPQLLDETNFENPWFAIQWTLSRFGKSSNVLGRKLSRVRLKIGKHNEQWKGEGHFIYHQIISVLHMIRGCFEKPYRISQLAIDPYTVTLIPHAPGIFCRADILENHMSQILEKIFNDRRNMAGIEPYLDEVFERFDDIEPQLPWLLENIDVLAPYTGLMMKHFDELLLYTHTDKECLELSNRMLPFVDSYLANLDILGPHLTLLRPHVHSMLKGNRIDKISPHIEKLFGRGYVDLNTSANMDVLLFWMGWMLQIPGCSRLLFSMPGCITIMNLLAKYLPHRFVRKYESRNVRTSLKSDYGFTWNRVTKEEATDPFFASLHAATVELGFEVNRVWSKLRRFFKSLVDIQVVEEEFAL